MTHTQTTGSCFCGQVRYAISGHMGLFQYCHCSRCRKFTGSAHAANLMVAPDQFEWLAGEDLVGRYIPEHTRHFTTSFCQRCGSSLPWLSKSGKAYLVPCGTLDDDPGIRPSHSIYWGSRAPWYTHVSELPMFEEIPPTD